MRKAAVAFLLLAGVAALPLALDQPVPTTAPVSIDQPDAIGCLLIPPCFRNSDCDAACGGPRTGRCVHNDCPIRICSCR
ncbi:MAG: hypothetical protein ACREAA_11940 [Candidatus Polarisedimenticolia bacterium]